MKNRNVPIVLLLFSLATAVWAQDLTFAAKVDKTTVNVGDPINLTITLSGQLEGTEVPPFQFPKEFAVAARSQSSEFSFHGGSATRSLNLSYVLIPQQAGTFQLGPFTIQRRGKSVPTEPIKITVEKSALPPHLRPEEGRFIL